MKTANVCRNETPKGKQHVKEGCVAAKEVEVNSESSPTAFLQSMWGWSVHIHKLNTKHLKTLVKSLHTETSVILNTN